MEKTRKLIYMSLLVAMALALHLVERHIPIPFMTPGAKLGLSNLVTVIALYTMAKREVAQIVFTRVVLAAFFGGYVSSLLYSSVGATLSLVVMFVVKKIGKEHVSMIGVSVAGAVAHNIGQVLVACLIVWNAGISLYLPLLTIAGIGTGIFVGMTANYTVTHMVRLPYFKNQ